MTHQQSPNHDGKPDELDAVLDAIRAKTPDEAQWTTARQRLLAALDRATTTRVAPSTAERQQRKGPAGRRRSRLAVTATFAAVLLCSLLVVSWQIGKKGMLATPPARVEWAREAYLMSAKLGKEQLLTPDAKMNAGDYVRVAPQGGLEVRMPDGSRLVLIGGAEAECIGPRSNGLPAWRLLRGEMQAAVTPANTQFRVAAPGILLRVVGTEFHLRIYPNQNYDKEKENRSMTTTASFLKKSIAVLTVLTGSVALDAFGREQIVAEGKRVTVAEDQSAAVSEEQAQTEYIRKWVTLRVAKPADVSRTEILVPFALHPGMLYRLMAIDVETGKSRHVADFVAGSFPTPQRVAPNLATLNLSSVCYWGLFSVNKGGGHTVIDDLAVLLDPTQGDKAVLPFHELFPMCVQFSPDRRKIAFTRHQPTNNLWVMDLETLKTTKAIEGYTNPPPAWSMDSRWLAVSKARGSQRDAYDIVLIDTLGGSKKSTGLRGVWARFSPDGKRLAYADSYLKGNLFLATLPDGAPEQITHVSDRGVVEPLFSPDGSHIAYWETPTTEDMRKQAFNDQYELHIVDLATKKDAAVFKVKGWPSTQEFRWLDDHSKLLFSDLHRDNSGNLIPGIKLLRRQGERWTVTEPKIDLLVVQGDEGVHKFAKRLLAVFQAHLDGSRAEELHQLDKARQKYALARNLAGQIVKDLTRGAGEGVAAVKLSPSDVLPYQQAMARKAAVSPQQLSVRLVRRNLEYVFPSLLENYYRIHDGFPSTEREAIEEAIKNIPRNADLPGLGLHGSEEVRRLFVVPGDDPGKKLTSYEVVRSDKDTFVLRTPVLANGKRLEATYRVGQDKTIEVEGKKIRRVIVKTDVTELE